MRRKNDRDVDKENYGKEEMKQGRRQEVQEMCLAGEEEDVMQVGKEEVWMESGDKERQRM